MNGSEEPSGSVGPLPFRMVTRDVRHRFATVVAASPHRRVSTQRRAYARRR